MEKKQYITPKMETMEIETESPMLSASNEVDIFEEETNADAIMSNKRRGKWGDLWAEEEL